MKTNNDSSNPIQATDSTATETESRTLTNTQLATIVECLRVLHPIVSTVGVFAPLPAFESCSEEHHCYILGRASKALMAKGEEMRAEQRAGVKSAVEAVIAQYRATFAEGRKAVEDFVKANPAAAAMVKLPESIDVPLFALLAAFPGNVKEETSEGATAILILRDLGHEVAYGQGKGKAKGPGYVRLAGTASTEKAATKAA